MRKRYTDFSKIMAVLLVLVMLIMCVPAGTVAADDTASAFDQVVYDGGWNPQQYPTTGELYKDRIAVSKTVTPTDKENYFDVNLEIVAKPRLIDQSIDVVVVMDVSNTMNYTHKGLGKDDAGYNIRDTRLTHAKAAVSEFIDLYAQHTNLSADRDFALVTFNSCANTLIPLTELNTENVAEELKAKVSDITASEDNRERFTNTEGGLQLAYNILNESDSAFKYIVFITDGYPSTYIEGENTDTEFLSGYDTCMSGNYDSAKAGQDGYFADMVTGKVCSHGVSYSDKAAQKAAEVAKSIKESGINMFSIGIDVDEQSVEDMLNTAEKTAYTTVDRTDESLLVGGSTEQYINWLTNSISGGAMIEAAEINEKIHRFTAIDSLDSLKTALEGILNDMEILPSETMEEAYTMDYLSDYVEFVNFFDLKGEAVNEVLNTRNGSFVATYTPDTKAVKWWLTATQKYHIDEIGNYVLSVSYRVRLKTEMQDFEFDKAFDTAKGTTFYFKTMDFTTGEPLYGDNSITYPVPQVKGYSCGFAFTNTDANTDKPLEGAEFTLRHYGESCHICGGDAVIDNYTATADELGVVSFDALPSGHEYLLVQTKAPQGYAKCGYHNLHILNSKAYFDGKEVTESEPAVVRNGMYEPASVILTAQKTLSGRELEEGEFAFVLEGETESMFHEKVRNNADGKAEFCEILFDKAGTYRFTVSEQQGEDSTVIYDKKVYNLEFNVTFTEGEGFAVETKVDGKNIDSNTALPVFEFASTLRKPVAVSLDAEKLFDSQTPEDGVFNFELKDSSGNLLQTKSTESGKIIFDEISFDKKGIYKYTINESHQCLAENAEVNVFIDHNIYEAVVTVTAPADSDSFEAEVKYYLQGEEAQKVLFSNLTRGKAQFTINAAVTLDGKAPDEGAYSFELREINGTLVERVQNDSQGNITFSPLEFTRDGYFVFFITQVAGEDSSITYCDAAYSVFVVSEVHHNLSSYYLDIIISEAQGDNMHKHIHLYGSELVLPVSYGVVFENTSAEVEPDSTEADTTTAPVLTEPADESEPATAATTGIPSEPEETTTALQNVTKPTDDKTDATSATEAQGKAPDTVPTGSNLHILLVAGVTLALLALVAVCKLRKSDKR